VPKPQQTIKNQILAAIPKDEYERLLSELEYVSLPLGQILYKSGEVIEHVYFPNDALISLITHMKDGTTIEVGLIGRDGMSGIPVLLGDDISFEEAVVQIAGSAMRMPSTALKTVLRQGHSPLLTELLLYTRVLMKQVAQTAACNRLHSVKQRLSRWLLMCHDRMESDELELTQEYIADMLGSRRAGVSNAATGLQADGAIRYSRGHITVLKRRALEKTSCECYEAVNA
jgi:CRP-like cAMP-binding protein